MEPVIKKNSQRTFSGTVISNAPNKTIVVAVERTREHVTYGKRYGVTKRYQVHDEQNRFTVGDAVTFVECRPLSKLKRWRVVYPKGQE